MNKKVFIIKILEFCELEMEDANIHTYLNAIDGYDSMSVMMMIAFIDENFGVQLSAEEFRSITDFKSLISLIGDEKFEDN